MSSKPRSDSKLKTLPEEQRQQLADWLLGRDCKAVSYKEAVRLCYSEFGVRTSVGAVQDFYTSELLLQQFSSARSIADSVREEMANRPEKFDEATIAVVSKRAFERAIAQKGTIADLVKLTKILGDSAKLKLKAQDQEHQREKFRASLRTKLESGLEALFQEIKGNPKALAAFEAMKAELKKN